jgi:hypothetical protein
MRWFRLRREKIAWLGCFALVCQLVLSFGHVHIGQASTKSVLSSILAGDGAASSKPGQPSHKNSSTAAEDYCAVCRSISLANTLIVPVAAAIEIPFNAFATLPWPAAEAEPTTLAFSRFRARGPPQA